MKKMFRCAMTVALSFSLVFGGVNSSTAEAFDFGSLAKGVLGIIGGGTDINTANKRMVENFNYSIALLTAAYQNVATATNDSIANKTLITQEQATKNALQSSEAGLNMKNGAEKNKEDATNMKKYLEAALAEGDQEKLNQIDSFMKAANNQRVLSDTMAGVAYAQATMIVMSQVKNAVSGNASSAIEGIGNIITVANEIQALLKVRKEVSEVLKTATQDYRKARGIKDPSKKEAKAAAKQIEKG